MNNVRINLIKRSEARYQGVVNPRFLAVTLGSAFIAALLLVIAARSLRYTYRKKELNDAQIHWEGISPRYENVKKVSAAIARQTKIIDELRARSEQAKTWTDCLLMIQSTVPENIQFKRMTLYSPVDANDESYSTFLITGVSRGEDAEDSVFSWLDQLKRNEVYQKYYDSLNLGYLRSSGRGAEIAQRDFEFKGGRMGAGPDDKGGR